jgi:hypothetical protein
VRVPVGNGREADARRLDDGVERMPGPTWPGAKEKVAHKIYFKIHDVIGYSARLAFTPRHDETLFPWEIVVKQ